MKNGFVALVGAGPGDIGLLTLRGMEYIQKADVILFDRLVSEEILELAPIEAKKINVGKESSNHSVSQEETNKILLDEALNGKIVVRLKGGDPFLFGRGGEELELLEQNNIPFEVVPGITSAISAPSYAGIPVTHRNFCSSVHIITGHKKNNSENDIDFKALVDTKGTLVFMMGVSSLKMIIDGLLKAGMIKETKAAIIENGTRPYQRKVVGNLENIYEKATCEKIKSPSVIVIGEVCQLSEKFDWFSKRILFGKKIIVTRPKASGGTLSIKLRELGAEVIDYPCIEIKKMDENEELEKILNRIEDFDWIVFTSKNGVNIFFEYFRNQGKDIRLLYKQKFATIGNQTSKALADYGIISDFVPNIYDGIHLGEGISEISKPKDNILLLRALEGNTEITDILRFNNRDYEDIPVYKTEYSNIKSQRFNEIMSENNEVYVTFTSASTVEGFVNTIEKSQIKKIVGICIGNQTSKAATKYGIKHFVSKDATIESMIDKIKEVI